MKRLMVALVAVACAAASYAETQWLDWFKLDKTNAESATWTGDGDVTVEGDKFIVDTDTSTGLTHTPTAATASEKGRQFTFDFSAEAPFDLLKLTIPADAKGGVTIAKNGSENLAFFVIGSESDALVWQEFTAAGTPTLDTDYTAAVTVDGTTVTYAIGGQTMVCTLPSSETAPAAFTVLGTGSFTEIDGKQAQEVVASITKDETTAYYATFAEAYAAAANGDTIKLLENVESAVAPAQKTVTIDENGKTFTLSKSVDENKVLRCVYANGQIVTQLDFDKDADGAYQIADESDLRKLAKAVAAGSVGKDAFKQTADIELTETFPGIGAPNAKDNINTAEYKDNAFQGLYDGQNHSIKGLVLGLEGKIDYIGLFNSCWEARIRNLKVGIGGTKGWASDDSDQVGAVIAGVTGKTIIENVETVVDGANDTFEASKTAAGIVGYAAGGTVLSNCINRLNIVSKGNEKCGGLIACVQDSGNFGGGVMIADCSNFGSVAASTGSYASGLVSYADVTVTFDGENIVGKAVEIAPSTCFSVIAVNNGAVALGDGATFAVPAAYKTVPDGKAVDGLFFATVEDGVATLVENAAVVKDGSYKVMAANAPAITLAEVGDEITIDTSLATATVTTTAANAYVDKDGDTYTVTAKTDYSTAAIEAFAEATWSETLDFPAVVVKAGGETVPEAAYDYAWSPAEIAAMKVGDPDATYTCTVTIKNTGKVILPAANPTAVWTVKAPAAPAGVTITVVRGTGIADIQKDNVSIFEDAETEKTLVLETGATSVSLTLVADGSIAIPVYKMSKAEIGAGPASKSGSYAIADGDKLTFTALEADVGGVTDAEAQAAIKEVVTSDAAKAKVDAVVEAGVNAKTLATWVGKQDDKTAALEGDYVKASVELDVAPITEGTEVKLVDVDMADVSAMTFKVAVGTDDVSAKEAVLSMVKAGEDVEFKTTFDPSATIAGEKGEKTVQVDISGKAAAFLKVEIPADAK